MPRLRRWVRRGVRGVLVLLTLVVLAVVLALYTSAGTRLVLRSGLSVYSGMIAGEIGLEDTEGSLADGVVVEGLVATDRTGRTLVALDRVRLRVDPWAALTGHVVLTGWQLHGGTVVVPPGEGYADLVPPPSPTPEADDEDEPGLGPDLPVRLTVALEVADVEVLAGPALDEAEQLTRVDALTLRAEGEGTHALVALSFRGWLGVPEAAVEGIELVAAWDEPQVTLSRLSVAGSPAQVHVAGLRLDAGTGALEVPWVAALLDAGWLEERLGRAMGAPLIRLQGGGRPEDLWLSLVAEHADVGSAEWSLRGRLVPPLDISTALRVETNPGRWIPGALAELLALDLSAALQEGSNEHLWIDAQARCEGCDPGRRSVSLDLRAHAEPTRERAEAWVDVRHGATHVSAHAAVGDELTGQLSLDPVDLAGVAALARRFGVSLALEGYVEGDLGCTSSRQLTPARCDVALALSEGQPVQEAAIAGVVSSSQLDRWRAELSRLQLTAAPVHVHLETPQARLEVTPERVSVQGLDLMVATDRGQGHLRLGGDYGLLDERASASLAVRGLDLAALDAWAPSVRARGIVHGDLTLAGALADPRAEVSLSIAGLGLRGLSVGRVTASATYGERGLSSALRVRSPTLGRWTADARLPVERSSNAPRLAVDEALHVELHGRDADLSSLRPLLPPDVRVGGMASVDLQLRGTAAQPVVIADLEGRALAYDGHALGDLTATAEYRRGQIEAQLRVEHDQIEEVYASARVPVALDLTSGRARWNPGRDHDARVRIHGLSLGLVETLTSVPVGGSVSLDATLAGTMRAPQLDGTLSFDGVGYDGRTVASGNLQASYRDDLVTAQAQAQGPAFRALELDASVPLTLALDRGALAWHSARPHDVELTLDGVRLAQLASWSDAAPDVGGRADARVHVRGDASDPRLLVSLEGNALAYGGRPVGDLSVRAEYADRAADATVQWTKDTRRFVRVRGRAPVELDPGSGRVRWRSDQAHRVTIEAPRIDPTLLEPFVVLPPSLDFAVSLHAIAEGNPAEHSIRASSRGFGAFEAVPRQSVDVALKVDQDDQRLDVQVGNSGTGLEFHAATRASTVDLVEGRLAVEDVPMSVSLRAPALSLALLEAIAPEQLHQVKGTAELEAELEGSLAKPVLSGRFEIDDAEGTLVALRQRIEQLDTVLILEGQELRLQRLALRSGRGTLQAEGWARLAPSGGLAAAMDVRGDRLPVRRPGLPYLEVSTALSTTLEMDARSTSVAVDLRETQVDVISTNVAEAKPIPSSVNVRYVSDLDAAPQPPEPEDEPLTSPRDTKLRLALVDPVRIRGPAIDMAWTGEMTATSRGEALDTRGSLRLKEGFFELLNNRFTIERGEVTIPPAESLRLYTDVAASTTVGEVEVTATIRGPLPRPELWLSSVPPYSASQLFALLMTGTADFDSADSERMQAQAASLLTAFSSPALQRQINERLRVDRIGLGVGESTNQPILSVGKSLTRKVYAETQYHHNAPDRSNRAELRVRYRFAPRWSLETFVGDAAVGGLDIFWGRVFDSRPRR